MSEPLSPLQRLKLIDLVNGLMQPDFEKLVFAIAAPQYLIPSNFSAQGNRSSALLHWVEGPTGCGLTIFLETLDAIAPGAFQVESSRSTPPVQNAAPISAPAENPNADFTLDLGSGVTLDMVYIPGGRFWMGSSKNEEGRNIYSSIGASIDEGLSIEEVRNNYPFIYKSLVNYQTLKNFEGPQHKVTIPAFYMGKYPVTQRQWRAVSLLDDLERHLAPNPSKFKGDDLPVEQVDWHEALEFCNRLPHQNGRLFRLPSEAEWEYACRAGTDSPFYFGETISTDQANYDGDYIYGKGKKGIYRKKTTAVGSFSPNAFGLYDMHGNVWEWCADHWHGNYNGSPDDGRPWVESGDGPRVIRGGFWDNGPRYCRSAYRGFIDAAIRSNGIGFRVCCSAPRLLP